MTKIKLPEKACEYLDNHGEKVMYSGCIWFTPDGTYFFPDHALPQDYQDIREALEYALRKAKGS